MHVTSNIFHLGNIGLSLRNRANKFILFRTPYTQTEGDTFIGAPRTATDGTNCFARPPRKVTRISVGNNTRRNINEEYATQTDVSYFKTACRTCQINAANDMSIKSTNCATSMMKTDLVNTYFSILEIRRRWEFSLRVEKRNIWNNNF